MAAAALANALMKDLGFITETDRVDVLDANKIQREKRRMCAASVQEHSADLRELKYIGLDSKRDAKSLVIQEVLEGDVLTAFKTTAVVDHLTFTVESGKKI
jgi:hypothetical protein